MSLLARVLPRALVPPRPGLYVALRPTRTIEVTELSFGVGTPLLLVADPAREDFAPLFLSTVARLALYEDLYGPIEIPAGEPPAPPPDDGRVFMELISCGGGYHDPRCSCFPVRWRPGSGLP